MSNPVQRGPGNDAFGGGALIRAAPPTSGPTGALPGPNTSTPLGGVNPPSTPFSRGPTRARTSASRTIASCRSPTRAAAVSRPLSSLMETTRPRLRSGTHMHADTQSKTLMSETDTLHATRIAFVLAKKSNVGITSQTADEDALRDFSYAINSAIAPVLPGTQKLQKLCSLEYLQRYIDTVANRALCQRHRPGSASYGRQRQRPRRPREGWRSAAEQQQAQRVAEEVRTSRRRLPGGVAAARCAHRYRRVRRVYHRRRYSRQVHPQNAQIGRKRGQHVCGCDQCRNHRGRVFDGGRQQEHRAQRHGWLLGLPPSDARCSTLATSVV